MKHEKRWFSSRAALSLCVVVIAAGCSGGSSDGTTPPIETTVTPPGANFACLQSQVLHLTVGEVRTALPGTSVCFTSSDNAEYLVHGFFGTSTATAQTQLSVTGFGITSVSSSAALANVGPGDGMADLDGLTPRQAIELGFRAYERNVLAPRMSGARRWYANRPNLSTVPATVGSAVTLNGSSTGCSSPNTRNGHVTAVSNRAIVVNDDANPSGGFTNAEFQAIATTFDTLVDPLDRAAFGDPSDIDGNSRVIIFYTRVVNELTPAQSEGVVEGFFNPRDLFPTSATSTLQACPGSNVAEMFYMIVPDPLGTINGNVRTKAQVQQSTISVTAHEYQHLINAARRLYVNDADDFEEVWLNEGLSHIAEELLFYRTSGLTPRANLDAATITASQKRVDAFNEHQVGNFGRYELFLERPETSSPYADNDSLSNRGAIWSFLRYAADRKATADGTLWFQLVNSKTTGMTNLGAVFTPDIMSWFRDWSISVYTDDRTATGSSWQQPSWQFRDIFPRVGVTTFPLKVRPLTNATATSVTLSGGGSMYGRLGVSAGTTAGVSWQGNATGMSFSIVRTK